VSPAGRSAVLLAAIVCGQFAEDLSALFLAFLRTRHFAILMMVIGISVLIWLRLVRLDHENDDDDEAPGPPAPRVVLPRQRVSVEEGAS
jgi:hypothetical protein